MKTEPTDHPDIYRDLAADLLRMPEHPVTEEQREARRRALSAEYHTPNPYRTALERCEHLLADMARHIVPGQSETPIEATLRVVREVLKGGAS